MGYYVDVLLSLGAAALVYSLVRLYTHRRKFKGLVSTPYCPSSFSQQTSLTASPPCHPPFFLYLLFPHPSSFPLFDIAEEGERKKSKKRKKKN